MLSYFNFGITALPLSILLSFASRSTGEELGWRGFMREEFNKRYDFLISSVCQGLVWCFRKKHSTFEEAEEDYAGTVG